MNRGATITALQWMGTAVLLGTVGCRRPEAGTAPASLPEDSRTSPASASSYSAPEVPLPSVPVLDAGMQPPPSSPEPRPEIPFRVCGITGHGPEVKVGLMHRPTGRLVVLRPGQAWEGCQLIEADSEREEARLVWQGQEIRLRLASAHGELPVTASDSAALSSKEPPPPTDPSALAASLDLSKFPKRFFEPTPEERSRGIDPNDPKTWPPDYRGPGIERAVREFKEGEGKVGPTLMTRPPTAFEPTPEERARGIDPNDPKTWPPDYRGPGIERALRGLPIPGYEERSADTTQGPSPAGTQASQLSSSP